MKHIPASYCAIQPCGAGQLSEIYAYIAIQCNLVQMVYCDAFYSYLHFLINEYSESTVLERRGGSSVGHLMPHD